MFATKKILAFNTKNNESFIIHELEGDSTKYFSFPIAKHSAFFNSRAAEFETIVKNATSQYPNEKYFEYTGSHFEPDDEHEWDSLSQTRIKED